MNNDWEWGGERGRAAPLLGLGVTQKLYRAVHFWQPKLYRPVHAILVAKSVPTLAKVSA